MKILLIGSGGRESALAWKLSQSSKVDELFIAPGNAGTAEYGTNLQIAADNLLALNEFALKEKVDLTVVGPEIPLAAGIVDLFKKDGLKVFGPNKKAAQLESSKIFSKKLIKKNIRYQQQNMKVLMIQIGQLNILNLKLRPWLLRLMAWQQARELL